MQGQFDTKGFRFAFFFIFGCLALFLLIKLAAASGFNAYFSHEVQSLFRNPSIALSGGPKGVSAAEYGVMDMESGTMLADKDPGGIRPTASLAKLMTASVGLQKLDLNEEVAVSPQAAAAYQEADFQPGEKWLVSDLFYPLLMESSNDAASVLAEAYPLKGGSKSASGNAAAATAVNSTPAEQAYAETAFVAQMNAEASALGMTESHFAEPSGLSDDDVSSVYDLLKLTSYILKNQPEIFAITKVRAKSVVTSDGVLQFGNINVFGDDPTFVGGKIGYTSDANETMIAVFTLPKGPEAGHTIGIVVLDSQNRVQDVSAILAWLEGPNS